MKHAYLILAHNEFQVLERLISALDDSRNDIYIHFDKKIEIFPSIKTYYSNLFILENRVDVSWGDVSMLEAEFNLFEAAEKEYPYQYYHLLSGVDMPIKSQNYIHNFFDDNQGKEFIGYSQGKTDAEIHRKVCLYHLFPKEFRSKNKFISKTKKFIRSLTIRIQLLFGTNRYTHQIFKKGPQWISVTHIFVTFLLKERQDILKKYQFTFCSDEIFIQTLCWNSPFKTQIFNTENSLIGCKRIINWENNKIMDWTITDVKLLIKSQALFARKFNSNKLEIVDEILKKIQ